MISPFKEILFGLVILFGIFWLATSTKSIQVKKRESATSSLFHSVFLIAGFLIAFWNKFQFAPLTFRFIPPDFIIYISGTLIATAGVGVAIWARIILGTNWNSAVSINKGQKLIQNGPYAIVRNPIYSGAIFFMIGTALISGELSGLLGLSLVLISVWHKAMGEENFLSEEFGGEYRDYQKRVRFMIPFIF